MGLKDQSGHGAGERFSSLAHPSYLQILVKLHFVPNHSHIQFILDAAQLQAASTVRWL